MVVVMMSQKNMFYFGRVKSGSSQLRKGSSPAVKEDGLFAHDQDDTGTHPLWVWLWNSSPCKDDFGHLSRPIKKLCRHDLIDLPELPVLDEVRQITAPTSLDFS